jgi:hypothetical protein
MRRLAAYEEGKPEPPLEWIEAFAKSADAHESVRWVNTEIA